MPQRLAAEDGGEVSGQLGDKQQAAGGLAGHCHGWRTWVTETARRRPASTRAAGTFKPRQHGGSAISVLDWKRLHAPRLHAPRHPGAKMRKIDVKPAAPGLPGFGCPLALDLRTRAGGSASQHQAAVGARLQRQMRYPRCLEPHFF